jgi:hypothetical protein
MVLGTERVNKEAVWQTDRKYIVILLKLILKITSYQGIEI